MFGITLVGLTFIIPICILWMDTENDLKLKHKIFLSFLFIIPVISQLVSMIFLILWLLDEFTLKFKPIPNPFKRTKKSQKQADDLPKCEFSKFIKYHSVFSMLDKSQTYLRTLWYSTNSTRFATYFHKLKSLFDDHRKSPYYKGSLLGSLERTFILWLDNIYEVDFKGAKRYYDVKFKLKQDITDEHIKFLNELIKAAEIPYEWIYNQELRDRREKENFEREQSNKLNHEFSEVVKSMKADLEKIYKKNENNTSEKERVRLL